MTRSVTAVHTADGTTLNVRVLKATTDGMLEETTGQTNNDIPSSYVSSGVLSTPWHGAGVDGVKYLPTDNGNSVVSGVVTEATGSTLSPTPKALVESAAKTNLIIYYDDFSNVIWPTIQSSVDADFAVSPKSGSLADKVSDNSVDTYHVISQFKAAVSMTHYTASVYVKDVDRGYCCIQIATDTASKRYSIIVDLSDGSKTDEDATGTPTDTSYRISEVDQFGYYRVEVTAYNAAGTCYLVVALSDSATPSSWSASLPTYIGDSSSILVWGGQLEVGQSASSIIPTVASSVQRNADALSYTGAWTADNETSAVTDAGTVEPDDWDGVVDATIVGADDIGEVESITVYTTGERP